MRVSKLGNRVGRAVGITLTAVREGEGTRVADKEGEKE